MSLYGPSQGSFKTTSFDWWRHVYYYGKFNKNNISLVGWLLVAWRPMANILIMFRNICHNYILTLALYDETINYAFIAWNSVSLYVFNYWVLISEWSPKRSQYTITYFLWLSKQKTRTLQRRHPVHRDTRVLVFLCMWLHGSLFCCDCFVDNVFIEK